MKPSPWSIVDSLSECCPPTVPVAELYFPDAVRSAKLKIYQQQWLSFYQFKLRQEGALIGE